MTINSQIIGFIGLGNMGEGFVFNLIDKGYQVVVNDIDKAKVKKAVNSGAQPTSDMRGLCKDAQIIGLSLPNTEIVCDVLQKADGVFDNAKKGCIIIDFSTISPTASRRLSAEANRRGLFYLDAPVSGGVVGARRGTLTIMVGGEEGVLKKVKEFLDDVGQKVVHIGPSGCGQTMKVIQNMVGALNVISAAEGICMGVKAGIQPTVLFDTLSSSVASSWLLQNYIPVQVGKNYEPASFSLNLMLKDVRLALKTGEDVGARVFMASLAEQLYSTIQSEGKGSKDYSVIFNLYEKLNNILQITNLREGNSSDV